MSKSRVLKTLILRLFRDQIQLGGGSRAFPLETMPQSAEEKWSILNSETRIVVERSPLRFYEKVIKVKADVAALHIVFLRHQRCCVRWRGELSRAPSLGVHLDP